MGMTLKGEFETRREAEMTIERLVQEYGIERDRIAVVASGSENSAGNEQAGSDGAAGEPTRDGREDAALHGAITVSVDLPDADLAERVRAAFSEFEATTVEG